MKGLIGEIVSKKPIVLKKENGKLINEKDLVITESMGGRKMNCELLEAETGNAINDNRAGSHWVYNHHHEVYCEGILVRSKLEIEDKVFAIKLKNGKYIIVDKIISIPKED